jgi:hypothetical protein
VGIFVDDILFINATGDDGAVKAVVDSLSKHYQIKLNDKLEKFLRAEFEETEEGIYMHLNQYVDKLMAKFDVGDQTAQTQEVADSAIEGGADVALLLHVDKKIYQEITGAVMFCMTTCRPDLAHAVNSLSRRMSAPRVCDLSNARRTLKYLNGNRRLQ